MPTPLETLQVSQSALELTTPVALPLGGYTARGGKDSEPGGETLYVRTDLLRSGKTQVAIVSFEGLTIPKSLFEAVQRRVPKGVLVFLTATHTHCAPDTQMLNDQMRIPIPGIATYRPRWLTWYADRIALGIQQAIQSSMEPVPSARYSEWPLGFNRPRRPGARPNKLAASLELRSLRIAHFSAHPTFFGASENRTHGDWPGAAMEAASCLILNGAIGDVAPWAPGARPTDRIDAVTAAFKNRFRTTAPSETISALPLKWASVPIALDAPTPHPTFGKTYGTTDEIARMITKSFAPTEASISAIRIGDLAIVGVPGEPTAALGARIEQAGKRAGFRATWVVSHVNGWIGYILEPQDYDRGGYEATLALHGRLTGEHLVAAATVALQRLKN